MHIFRRGVLSTDRFIILINNSTILTDDLCAVFRDGSNCAIKTGRTRVPGPPKIEHTNNL